MKFGKEAWNGDKDQGIISIKRWLNKRNDKITQRGYQGDKYTIWGGPQLLRAFPAGSVGK